MNSESRVTLKVLESKIDMYYYFEINIEERKNRDIAILQSDIDTHCMIVANA